MDSPYEFRITGTSRGRAASWRTDVGSEVPPPAGDFLLHLVGASRYTGWRKLGEADEMESFLTELHLRGYDISTLRFSLFLKGHGTPQKPRVLRIRSATLHARWGRDTHDETPDICTCWASPARRSDSNLFMSLMSQPAHFSQLGARYANAHGQFQSARDKLEALGWDLRTLKLSVKHLGWLYRPEYAGEP